MSKTAHHLPWEHRVRDEALAHRLVDYEYQREQQGGGAHFSLERLSRRYFKQFKTTSMDYKLQLPPWPTRNNGRSPIENRPRNLQIMNERLSQLIFQLKTGMEDQDYMGICMRNDKLKSPLWIPPRRVDQLDAIAMMEQVEKALTSNADCMFDGIFHVTVVHFRMPVGGAGRKTKFSLGKTVAENLAAKNRSVFRSEEHTSELQ